MVDRRGFLSSFAGAAAMGATLNFGGGLLAQLAQAPGQLPDRGLCDSNEEAYDGAAQAVSDSGGRM
jgi:hypothetical protein